MNRLFPDVRFALRALRRRPAFTAAALALLALGIGANTAIFSVVRAVVLRPLPYPKPDRLVALLGTREGAPTPSGVLSAPDVADYGDQASSLAAVGGVATGRRNLTGAGDPASVAVGRFTPGFFPSLSVVPSLGRLPSRDEHAGAGSAVAVLSDGSWRARFGADPDVIGRLVRIDDEAVTVIGVLPGPWPCRACFVACCSRSVRPTHRRFLLPPSSCSSSRWPEATCPHDARPAPTHWRPSDMSDILDDLRYALRALARNA